MPFAMPIWIPGVNAQDKWGATALHWAADQEIVICMLCNFRRLLGPQAGSAFGSLFFIYFAFAIRLFNVAFFLHLLFAFFCVCCRA